MNLNVSSMTKHTFVLEVSDNIDPSLADGEFVKKSHASVNLYLVALNIATLGLFLRQGAGNLSPEYVLLNKETGTISRSVITHNIHDTNLHGRIISESEVFESLCLYGCLARESNNELVSEYLKGLVHLGINYPGAHFEKDAFANFYRAFEHLVTARLRKQKKLKGELSQLTDTLASLGLGTDTIEEFKQLYTVRGEQAMHAQKAPKRISREDAMKMKVFTDIVFRMTYKPEWDEMLSKDMP